MGLVVRIVAGMLIALQMKATTAQERPCYTNLTKLNEDIAIKNAYEIVDYILCPNTQFELEGENKQERIQLHTNMRVLCGEDGSVGNNCTVHRGSIQVQCKTGSFDEPTKRNVNISGITFQDAKVTSVLVSCGGDVAFNDCVFQYHERGLEPVKFNYDGAGRRLAQQQPQRRDDGMVPAGVSHNIVHGRNLQGEIDEFVGTFDHCVFQFNNHGQSTSSSQKHSVISVQKHNRLIVSNTVFHDNDFGDEERTENSRIILLEEGALVELEDNCFLINDVIGRGPVNVVSAEQVISAQGNFGTFDDGTDCQFIHAEDTGQCISYDLESCPLTFDFTSSAPTPAPAAAKSKASVGPIDTLGTIAFLISFGLLLL